MERIANHDPLCHAGVGCGSGRLSRDGVADAVPSQPGSYRARAVALVAQHVGGPRPGTARARARYPDRLHHGGEPGAVVGVAAREHEGERAPEGVAGQVDLAGQTAPGASERGAAEPPFRAPAACRWARTTVESTDTSQSISPAASARASRSAGPGDSRAAPRRRCAVPRHRGPAAARGAGAVHDRPRHCGRDPLGHSSRPPSPAGEICSPAVATQAWKLAGMARAPRTRWHPRLHPNECKIPSVVDVRAA
jgi:hypothetical protein